MYLNQLLRLVNLLINTKNQSLTLFPGEKISEIACESPTFTVAWHPKRNLLAYACDDKYDRDRDERGTVKVYGFPSGDS